FRHVQIVRVSAYSRARSRQKVKKDTTAPRLACLCPPAPLARASARSLPHRHHCLTGNSEANFIAGPQCLYKLARVSVIEHSVAFSRLRAASTRLPLASANIAHAS
uniref:Uncharacterized protein n=1 Tax=Aegilops tauschii subsp. strangulata TaxID=200361 RepID=A0A452Z999_AEGTS